MERRVCYITISVFICLESSMISSKIQKGKKGQERKHIVKILKSRHRPRSRALPQNLIFSLPKQWEAKNKNNFLVLKPSGGKVLMHVSSPENSLRGKRLELPPKGPPCSPWSRLPLMPPHTSAGRTRTLSERRAHGLKHRTGSPPQGVARSPGKP